MQLTEIITLISALASGLGGGGLLGYRLARKKDQSAADVQLLTANVTLVNTLINRITKLEDDYAAQQDECDKKIELLHKQLHQQGLEIVTLKLQLGITVTNAPIPPTAT